MEVFSLFPTPIGKFILNEPLKKTELKFIDKFQQTPNAGNTTSSDKKILEYKELKRIRTFIQESIDTFFNEINKPSDKVKLRITQSWLNWTSTAQFHHRHAHPNSYYSGVFYITSDEDDKIIFYEKEEYKKISIQQQEFNIFNSPSWWLPSQQNLLYIFPSYLKHEVPIVKNADHVRISLAFNTFPYGELGAEDDATGLYLSP